jgi:DNA-binding transcriptional MerR regulator
MSEMAKRQAKQLYSLSEISRRTGISMVSLRRYRTMYPDRVPSVGEGRRQRFPAAAVPVFEQLKVEGIARRGRGSSGAGGSKRGAARRARATRGAAGRSDSMLTLVEIGKRTGISYPTLLRYVRLYLDRLPHSGSGRQRRFSPAAVEEFKKLRSESRRGRRPAAQSPASVAPGLSRQLAKLERGQRSLERQLRDLRKSLARPVRFRLER